MKKLLTLIATMIMCNAYGEGVAWVTDSSTASSTSCTVGGNIAKPADPTKSGYRFVGWKEGSLEDILSIDGTSRSPSSASSSSSTWSVYFPYGTVSGEKRCSKDPATSDRAECLSSTTCYTSSNPSISATSSENVNCWVRITSSTLGSLFDYSSLPWVGENVYGSYGDCNKYCAWHAAGRVQSFVRMRQYVFGLMQ